MTDKRKTDDGFRFLHSPQLADWYRREIQNEPFSGEIPFTALRKPLSETSFTLVTSSAISMKTDAPFDMETEKQNPLRGDTSYREIPRTATERDIEVSHQHINTDYIKRDMNVMLPIARFREFEEEGIIGRLTPTVYSYYGFQIDHRELLQNTLQKVVEQMREESAEAVLLTPA